MVASFRSFGYSGLMLGTLKRLVKKLLNISGFNRFLHQWFFYKKPTTLVSFQNCQFCCSQQIEHEAQLIENHYSETRILGELLMKLTRFKGLFLDIGANIGIFSIPIGKMPEIEVFAFEPDPLNFSRLTQNLKLNPSSRVRAFNVACSIKDQAFLDFTIPFDHNRGVSFIGKFHESPFWTWETHVKSICLDLFLEKETQKKICGFKIDVEGHELQVLKGLEKTLSCTTSCLGIIEIHIERFKVNPKEIKDLLENCGFLLMEINRQGILLPYHYQRHDDHTLWALKKPLGIS